LQKVRNLSIDCDADVLLLKIEQIGGIACHTGRQSCFLSSIDSWAMARNREKVIKNPDEMHRH
jgi:hypothetical protein